MFGCCYWIDFNECESGTPLCDENAFCVNTDGGFHCICDIGYTGSGDIENCSGMLTVYGMSQEEKFYHLFHRYQRVCTRVE